MSEQEDALNIDVSRYCKYMAIVATALALSNPIELVKTRMQTSSELVAKLAIPTPYTSVTSTFVRVVKEEKFRGLFKGVHYFLLRTLPSNIGVFTIKELIHRRLTRYMKTSQQSELKKMVNKHFFVVNSAIGGAAGLLIQIVLYPFDYFRIILSNEVKSHPGYGIVKCIKEAMHHKGLLGIFNGVSINLVYMTLARGIYFGLYDSYKKQVENEKAKILFSYLSLCVALLVCYPLDTVRKRVVVSSNKHKNSRQCFKHIWINEKLGAFYHGWRIISIQSISFCILYYLYDVMFTQVFSKKKNP